MLEIDLLIIFYDYYDYLDYVIICVLLLKIKWVIMLLGVGLYLCYWGMDGVLIIEVDW